MNFIGSLSMLAYDFKLSLWSSRLSRVFSEIMVEIILLASFSFLLPSTSFPQQPWPFGFHSTTDQSWCSAFIGPSLWNALSFFAPQFYLAVSPCALLQACFSLGLAHWVCLWTFHPTRGTLCKCLNTIPEKTRQHITVIKIANNLWSISLITESLVSSGKNVREEFVSSGTSTCGYTSQQQSQERG